MNPYSIICGFLLTTLFILACQNPGEKPLNQSLMLNKTDIEPPVAEKDNKELSAHGDLRSDPYYWMRLTDEQKTASEKDEHTQKVLAYLNAENDYRESLMAHTQHVQEELYEEIVGRYKKTDMSVPFLDNGYYYITRYEGDQEHPIYSRKKGSLEAQEEIMLNVNRLASPYEYYRVAGRSVSPDNRILCFGEDTLSRRIYTLKFKDLSTGELLTDQIQGTSGSAVWANDSQKLFYVKKDPLTLRSFQVFRHKLGETQEQDKLIYTETDETFYTYVFKTKSKKYICIGSGHTLTNEYRLIDADEPFGEARLFHPRNKEGNLEYSISHLEDRWYILTNHEAKNFRIMETADRATGISNWKEVIPHRNNVLLEDMDVFKDYLVLTERIAGISELRVISSEADFHIDFDEESHTVYARDNMEFDSKILRFQYQSLTTPPSIFEYDMQERSRELLKQEEVLGGFDSEDYVSERVFAKARDGVEIPVSIVYHKDTPIDGTSPCLLYAYGSYGASMNPSFSMSRLSILNRGFVYAIAHIRGGQEMGRQWYEDGKLLKKKNTFFDFIDSGEHLIVEKYADPDRLFAMGGSAGGLLMGAIVNYRPDLWKGIVAAVPFVDVVTTMLDETIPLTTFEFDEWGNPNEKEYYEYMKSYSPYDNVEAKEYPSILVTTGLFDSQVQYWEPAKWVAKLRDLKTDRNPLLLYCNMDTGHGGASGRFERHKETAMEYTFILDLAGLISEEVKG